MRIVCLISCSYDPGLVEEGTKALARSKDDAVKMGRIDIQPATDFFFVLLVEVEALEKLAIARYREFGEQRMQHVSQLCAAELIWRVAGCRNMLNGIDRLGGATVALLGTRSVRDRCLNVGWERDRVADGTCAQTFENA